MEYNFGLYIINGPSVSAKGNINNSNYQCFFFSISLNFKWLAVKETYSLVGIKIMVSKLIFSSPSRDIQNAYEEQIFPVWIDPFSERAQCTGKQTKTKSCLFLSR